MTRPRRSSDPVVFSTPSGRRRIKVTLGLTVGAAMAEAGSFVALGRLFDAGVSTGLAVAAIVLGLGGAAAAVIAQWLAQNGARTEEAPLRARLLRRWWDGPPERQHDERAGGLVSLMTDSVERVSTYRQTFLGPTVGAVLAPLGVLVVVAFAVDPVAAGLLALAIPAIPLAIRGFQKAFRQDSAASRAARVRLAGRYLEAIQGLETITLLGAAPRVEADLARVGEDNRRAAMRLLRALPHATLIEVTHRVANSLTADHVIVFDQGRVVEAGHPADLAATRGGYARLLARDDSPAPMNELAKSGYEEGIRTASACELVKSGYERPGRPRNRTLRVRSLVWARNRPHNRTLRVPISAG